MKRKVEKMKGSERQVRFVDLRAQYEDVRDEVRQLFESLLDSSQFVGGSILERFESNLAKYVGVEHAVGCSDGTMALILSMLGAGMKPGEKAALPVNTFIATANAVVHAGGVPVFIDCNDCTYLINLNRLEESLKRERVHFVIPVHLYGNPCQIDDLLFLSSRYDFRIIEDNAQALGASFKGKKTGSFGIAAGVSFYPAKNLGAFGQGGAVLTNDLSLAASARTFREQGQGKEKYYHEVIGYNGRLDTLQAGFLDILLKKLDSFNEKRRVIAGAYRRRLPADRLQSTTAESVHVYHLFEYKCKNSQERKKLGEMLALAKCDFGYHYPVPIHKQKAYQQYNKQTFRSAEQLAETLISLPMHPGLTEEDVNRVCDVIERVGF